MWWGEPLACRLPGGAPGPVASAGRAARRGRQRAGRRGGQARATPGTARTACSSSRRSNLQAAGGAVRKDRCVRMLHVCACRRGAGGGCAVCRMFGAHATRAAHATCAMRALRAARARGRGSGSGGHQMFVGSDGAAGARLMRAGAAPAQGSSGRPYFLRMLARRVVPHAQRCA